MVLLYKLKRIRYNFLYYYRYTRRFQHSILPKLTKTEKHAIKECWPGVTILPVDFVCARVFKKIHGFSPYYLAPCWYNEIRQGTNPKDQLYSLENKALCDLYFDDLSFPEPYVRRLNGSFYDKEMHYISKEEAIGILKSKNEFIIKPAIGTLKGDGVVKVDCKKDDINQAIETAGRNFIAQEVLKQADEIERLNPSSLNCFRVTTIYINNRFGYATSLKVAKKGSVRDNWNSAYWINVNNEGRLSEFGYDYDVNPIAHSDSGIVFKDILIPHFQEMIAYLEKMHKKYFANCGVIGWDVTLDKEYKVSVIETNLWNPGTNIEQFVSGDFFKPFRDDMLMYLRVKK